MESDHSRRSQLRELEAQAEIAAARLEHEARAAVSALRDHLEVLLAFEHSALGPPRRSNATAGVPHDRPRG